MKVYQRHCKRCILSAVLNESLVTLSLINTKINVSCQKWHAFMIHIKARKNSCKFCESLVTKSNPWQEKHMNESEKWMTLIPHSFLQWTIDTTQINEVLCVTAMENRCFQNCKNFLTYFWALPYFKIINCTFIIIIIQCPY